MHTAPSAPSSNSRESAARLLYQWQQHGDMPARLLEEQVEHRAFVTEMVLGVVRHWDSLEWIIHKLAPRRPSDELMPVLSVGLYQLLLLDQVEPYAAVHETVEAAKTLCGPKRAGFVNAILRRALREKEALLAQLKKQPTHIRYSHPRELIDRWTAHFGARDTRQLCAWNNERPELIVRVRPTISMEGFLTTLQEGGLPAIPHAQDGFVVLPPRIRIEDCPGYAEGWFTVQDPATLAAVDVLNPQPGERILDACAAPGGKTIAIADRMEKEGELIACDISAHRMKRLADNLNRCGTKQVQMHVVNALEMTPDTFGGTLFDGVLLDVPCSNTGVIRRRPDARQRLTTEHLRQLCTLQSQLLDGAAALVRTGGRLVYSTCSLEPEENEDQVAAWLKRNPSFRLDQESRRFPPRDRMDGAYAARLIRTD